MKILLIYSRGGKTQSRIERYANSLRKGAEANGHQVVVKTTNDSNELLSCHSYDLLIVGSPVLGVLGGKVAEDLKPFMNSLKRTEGQEAVAFADRKIFGTDKALRKLMGLMESQGCIVNNFRGLRSQADAFEFGRQI